MILESNKIYRCIPFISSPVFPSLNVKGSTSLYVSLKEYMPESTADMDDVSDQIKEGYNVLNGQIRYICAVYGEGSVVEESGIVSAQEHIERK